MGALTSKRKESSLEGEEISFDHFQVLRAIGKGSFGKVCIVQKRDSKQMFAMKYMNKTQCEARDALNNVFREIEILASLNHPFLVNLWFSFQDSEDMFMVVDLLLGGDLRYHVQQGVQFTDQDVRLYILEVASALAYLHARNIIHRDIKPDNLLLDEEGHVHLTDFNIATVLRSGQLATSMSGTKPYMAPEVFECAGERCEGYGRQVDWWSLGVTAYEVRRGKRPYDIHSNTCLHDIRRMLHQPPRFPQDCHPSLVHLLSRLLVVSPEQRLSSLEDLLEMPYVAALDMEDLLQKRCRPAFTPPKDHLNCDPTFELEEMIIESKPLHKKKKRLSKQKSLRETHSSISGTTEGEGVVYEAMLVFNREQTEARKALEKLEQQWQEELEQSMRLSDPTGHGCSFAGSQSGTPVRVRSGGEGRGSGQGGSSPPVTPRPPSPTDHPPLTKVTVSPSNVRARIAGSPKVKVRGSTVTIESPRSSSSLTKTSTHLLKERLRELKADRHPQGGSGSESDCSDVTQSDDLTLTGRRSPGRPKRRSVSKSPERSQQRRSASRSPKVSPRKSASGSPRSPRTPARSTRKSAAGRASREVQETSAQPQEARVEATICPAQEDRVEASTSPALEARVEASTSPALEARVEASTSPALEARVEASTSPALETQPSGTSKAAGDRVLARPVSLPAAVRVDVQEFSRLRISVPPLVGLSGVVVSSSSSSSSQGHHTTTTTTQHQHQHQQTSESSSRPAGPPAPGASDNTALPNGSLASTGAPRASLGLQDLKLEAGLHEGKPKALGQERRHSMEPKRRTKEHSKRFSEGHRSCSVTGPANPGTWSTPAPQGGTPALQGGTAAPQGGTPAPQGGTAAPQPGRNSSHVRRKASDTRKHSVEAAGQGPCEGPAEGPCEGPAEGPCEGPAEGPAEGPCEGPEEGPDEGPCEGPEEGPDEGPCEGPAEGPCEGPEEGPCEGPAEGPCEGPAEGPCEGPEEGPCEGPDEGPCEGPTEGPAEGPCEGPAEEPCEGPDEGPCEGPTEGQVEGPCEGPDEGPCEGPTEEPCEGPTEGQVEGLVDGPCPSMTEDTTQGHRKSHESPRSSWDASRESSAPGVRTLPCQGGGDPSTPPHQETQAEQNPADSQGSSRTSTSDQGIEMTC